MHQLAQRTTWTTASKVHPEQSNEAPPNRPYDVVMGVNDINPAQWGIVGKIIPTEKEKRQRTIAFDWNHVHCMSLVGQPGVGKSYTLGTLIESAVSSNQALNHLPNPCCCLMIHYSESAEYAPEFNTMCMPNGTGPEVDALQKNYQAQPNAVEDLVVIAPKESLLKRRRENPHITHHPFAFHPDEIQVSQWKMLMGANGEKGDYINEIKLLLRKHQDNLSVAVLREAIKSSNLSPADKERADQRLRTAENFIDSRYGIKRLVKPGRLIVVDFRDELLEIDEVCSLIVVLIQAFGDAKRYEMGGGTVNKDNPYAKMLGLGKSEDEVWFEANEHNKRVQQEIAEVTNQFLNLQDSTILPLHGLQWIGHTVRRMLAEQMPMADQDAIIAAYARQCEQTLSEGVSDYEQSLFPEHMQKNIEHKLAPAAKRITERSLACDSLYACVRQKDWPETLGIEWAAFLNVAIKQIAPFLTERQESAQRICGEVMTYLMTTTIADATDYQNRAAELIRRLKKSPVNTDNGDDNTIANLLIENIAHQAETYGLLTPYLHGDSDADWSRLVGDFDPAAARSLFNAAIWEELYNVMGSNLAEQTKLLSEIEALNSKLIKGQIVNKLVVADEAHKFLKPEYKELVNAFELAIREMRHKACSMLVASQDPPSIPKQILELSTHFIIHKMSAPAWLTHLKTANSMLDELKPAMVGELKPGEGFAWATRASEYVYTQGATKVMFRPRASQHGGATKTAIKGTGHIGV